MNPRNSFSLIFTLLVATCLPIAAAQSGYPSSAQAEQTRGGTATTFPTELYPSSTMPPDTAAPPATESSNVKIAGQIRTAMAQERRLKNANVTVNVTDDHVMLAGHVSDNNNRYLALRIASDYVGTRTLVDKLRMGNEQ